MQGKTIVLLVVLLSATFYQINADCTTAIGDQKVGCPCRQDDQCWAGTTNHDLYSCKRRVCVKNVEDGDSTGGSTGGGSTGGSGGGTVPTPPTGKLINNSTCATFSNQNVMGLSVGYATRFAAQNIAYVDLANIPFAQRLPDCSCSVDAECPLYMRCLSDANSALVCQNQANGLPQNRLIRLYTCTSAVQAECQLSCNSILGFIGGLQTWNSYTQVFGYYNLAGNTYCAAFIADLALYSTIP